MSLAKSSHIHEFCQPNALLTFREYLCDYASPDTVKLAEYAIRQAFAEVDPRLKQECERRLQRIMSGERDLYF